MGQCSTLPAQEREGSSAASAAVDGDVGGVCGGGNNGGLGGASSFGGGGRHHGDGNTGTGPGYGGVGGAAAGHNIPPLSPRSPVKQRRQAGYQPVGTMHYGRQQGQGGASSVASATSASHAAQSVRDARDDNSSRGGIRQEERGDDHSSVGSSIMMSMHQQRQRQLESMVSSVRNSVNAMDPFLNNGGGMRHNPHNEDVHEPSAMQGIVVYGERGRGGADGSDYYHTSRANGAAPSSAVGTHVAAASEAMPTEEMQEEVAIRLPENAVRARCYRLNLEQPPSLSVDPATGRPLPVGPMIYEPPPHHLPRSMSYSVSGGGNGSRIGGSNNNRRRIHSWGQGASGGMGSLVGGKVGGGGTRAMSPTSFGNGGSGNCNDDMSVSTAGSSGGSKSATQVAISTARIFRGITVDGNGTILSQNARATRSNKRAGGGANSGTSGGNGNDKKKGEKSRQAAKIDKAKDLVEEAVAGGGARDDGEAPNMVSLVIMGEYDNMKHLVRDGSKKLREAEGLPDEALLALNRPRVMSPSSGTSVSSQGGGTGGGGHRAQPQQGVTASSSTSVSYGGSVSASIPPASPGSAARKRGQGGVVPHPSYGSPKAKNRTNGNGGETSSYGGGGSSHGGAVGYPQQQQTGATTPSTGTGGGGAAGGGGGSSAPPKLKAHPRDSMTSSRSRRGVNNNNNNNNNNASTNHDSGGPGGAGQDDGRRFFPNHTSAHCSDSTPWEALGLHSIWNCGANRTGTVSSSAMSPTNTGGGGPVFDGSSAPQSPNAGGKAQVSPYHGHHYHQGHNQYQLQQQHQYHAYDERNEVDSYARMGTGGGASDRMDAPVYA